MTNLLTGGAILGVLAGFWQQLKDSAWKIVSMFVQQVEIPTAEAHEAVTAYLIANYKRASVYDKAYGAVYERLRDGRYGLVPYEQFGHRTIFFWNKHIPFVFRNQIETNPQSEEKHQYGMSKQLQVFSTITFIRGTLNVDDLIMKACQQRNDLAWAAAESEDEATRFNIHYLPAKQVEHEEYRIGSDGLAWYQQKRYRLLGYTPEQLGKEPTSKGQALSNLIFPKKIKSLIKEVELWRKSRDWYRSRGIAWKRGWLLYGPPGTGKTALARAFAEDLNMPIYVFNLAQMDNAELIRSWTKMQVNVPCIALLEDMDNIFHGRENVSRRNNAMSFLMRDDKDEENDGDSNTSSTSFAPLTFDCLLNCLDGIERNDGIFTIITANNLDKIDPALGQPRKLDDGTVEFISTRPGRIDKAVLLTYMEKQDKRAMAERMLADYPESLADVLRGIESSDLQETPAQFQEICCQVALSCYWRENNILEEREGKLAHSSLV